MIDEEVARLRKQVKVFYRRLQRELPGVHGLSQTGIQMLAIVRRSPDGVRPGQLATELQMTNSNVAAALRILEAQGLVVRRNDPTDGRKAFIDATELGVEVGAKIRGSHYAWMRETIGSVLTEDEQRLLLKAGDLMQRLAEHVPTPVVYEPAPRRKAAAAAESRKTPAARARATAR